MNKEHIILIIAVLTLVAKAQPNFPPPAGIYCSCPPTTNTTTGISVMPAVAAKPFVKGILVRVNWKDVEPTDNNYNWALIDHQISLANAAGKKISLGVGGGPNSPQWLYGLGVQSQSYTIPFTATVPVIWDATFLNKWTEFVIAFGNKYKNDTTVRMVYITNGTTNGYEMQLPFNPSPSHASVGYTDQKVINSWKRVIDTFNVAFPNHYLTNDFHPVNSSNAVADSVYLYARTKIPNRYGANAWWWTQNNTAVYPSQYNILQHSANNLVFSGLQMALSHTSDSASFGGSGGGIYGALSLAISKNVCYWEIWNSDILNNNLTSLFTNSTSCQTTTGLEKLSSEKNSFIYPNPTSGILTITDLNATQLSIFDLAGREVLDINIKQQSIIELKNIPSGIYFARILSSNKYYHQKLIIE